MITPVPSVRRPRSREDKFFDVPVPNLGQAIRRLGFAQSAMSSVHIANFAGRVPMDEQSKALFDKVCDDLHSLIRRLETSVPAEPWRSVSVRGRELTIEEVFARWRAGYSRRWPPAHVPKDIAVERVRAAIDAGLHRTFNGEVPARIFGWMDSRAFNPVEQIARVAAEGGR